MMNSYAWWQWILYFYVYCFAGWIWECLYVSVRTGKFVNRGFLHLPLLPLYGSGAVVVLFATLPFREQPVLLFLAGMAAATCLELATGLTMERIYKVKYWDYTECFLNYKGVICLKASLCWGAFSLALVRVAHVRVERLLDHLPLTFVLILEAVVTVLFVQDFYVSNRDALQLATVLSAMEKAKDQMQEDLRKLEQELADQRQQLEQQLAEAKDAAQDQIEDALLIAMERAEEIHHRAEEIRIFMEDSREFEVQEMRRGLEEMRRMREHVIEGVRLNAMFRTRDLTERFSQLREEYMEAQEKRLQNAERISRSILLRNPSARLVRHKKMSDLLRRKAEER